MGWGVVGGPAFSGGDAGGWSALGPRNADAWRNAITPTCSGWNPPIQHQGRLLTRAEAEEAGLGRRTPPQLRLEQIRDIGRCLARQPVEAKRGHGCD